MREILFRGKKKDGEWVEGDLLHWNKFYCIVEWDAKVEDINVANMRVIPETVGQFTGLKDKNGIKIFEGDIVKAWSGGLVAIGKVVQRTDGLWIIYPAYQKQNFWGLIPNDKGETTVEIIGNIHDNPELLEVN